MVILFLPSNHGNKTILSLSHFPNNAYYDNEEISGEDNVYLKEKLIEIKTVRVVFDINAAKAALHDLKQKTWPRHIDAVLDDIAVHLLHSAFNEAETAADSVIS